MIALDEERTNFNRAVGYIHQYMIPADELAVRSGVSQRTFELLEKAGAIPAPTYTIYRNAIQSPIAVLGARGVDEVGGEYFGPSVLWWVRRAAVLASDGSTPDRLSRWFARLFEQAVAERSEECRRYGWAHLFAGENADAQLIEAEAAALWRDWMGGGWAVCLRRWTGRSVVTKEMERARIALLTANQSREANDLSADERRQLFDAVDALDAVLMPFAPHERPTATPGQFIDAIRQKYRLWSDEAPI